MPLWITVDAEASPISIGNRARAKIINYSSKISRGTTPTMTAFKGIVAMFAQIDAKALKLKWLGWAFIAIGPTEPAKWKQVLPATINGLPTARTTPVRTKIRSQPRNTSLAPALCPATTTTPLSPAPSSS
ncbi:hypothetical protein MMC28_007091 [Mycoblastus sanguinarius]|nr:hypothetical protein [Mycoblastus sanguinarius]